MKTHSVSRAAVELLAPCSCWWWKLENASSSPHSQCPGLKQRSLHRWLVCRSPLGPCWTCACTDRRCCKSIRRHRPAHKAALRCRSSPLLGTDQSSTIQIVEMKMNQSDSSQHGLNTHSEIRYQFASTIEDVNGRLEGRVGLCAFGKWFDDCNWTSEWRRKDCDIIQAKVEVLPEQLIELNFPDGVRRDNFVRLEIGNFEIELPVGVVAKGEPVTDVVEETHLGGLIWWRENCNVYNFQFEVF